MTAHNILLVIIIAVVAAIIDYLWLGLIARDFYTRELGSLGREPGAQLDVRILAAIGVYPLIALSVVFGALQLGNGSFTHTLLYGAAVGLAIYGIYEFTNYAVLEGWSVRIVLVDIIWGTFLFALLSGIAHYIQKLLF